MTTSPKECRGGNCCQPVTLREAWHCQIHHSAMRLDELARRVGMAPSTLSAFVNPYSTGSPLPAKHHELLLELTADNLAVVTYLSRKQNAVTVRVNEASSMRRMADALKSFGSLVETKAEADADGVYTPDEAHRVAHQAFDHIETIVAIAKDAERRASDPQSRVVPLERRA